MLRLLDLLVVTKDDNGALDRMAIGDDGDFGTLLAGLLPVDGADGRSEDGDDATGGDPSAVWALAESLVPGTAIAFLLVQHGWAQPCWTRSPRPAGRLSAAAC